MEEPGGLQSMGSQRVGRDWATSLLHISQLAKESEPWVWWAWQGGQWFQSVFPSIPAPNKYTHTQHTYCSRSMETYGQWIYRVLASEAREALPWPGLFSIVIRYLFAKGPTALTWGQTEHPEFPKKLLGGWHGLWLEPFVVLLNNFYLFTYLLLSVLGLHFCVGFSLVEASRAYSLVSVGGHLIALPAFVERRLEGDWLSSFGSWAREHRFNSCAQALLFQGIWDLPRSGIKFMLPWNSSQCYVEVWAGREFAGEWTRVCVWLFTWNITALLTSYISIQKKTFVFFLILFFKVSPGLSDGFFTPEPPGKPWLEFWCLTGASAGCM